MRRSLPAPGPRRVALASKGRCDGGAHEGRLAASTRTGERDERGAVYPRQYGRMSASPNGIALFVLDCCKRRVRDRDTRLALRIADGCNRKRGICRSIDCSSAASSSERSIPSSSSSRRRACESSQAPRLSDTAIQGNGEDLYRRSIGAAHPGESFRPWLTIGDIVPEVERFPEPSLLCGGTEIDEALRLGVGGRPIEQVGEGPPLQSSSDWEKVTSRDPAHHLVACAMPSPTNRSNRAACRPNRGVTLFPYPSGTVSDRGDTFMASQPRSRSAPAWPMLADVPHPDRVSDVLGRERITGPKHERGEDCSPAD